VAPGTRAALHVVQSNGEVYEYEFDAEELYPDGHVLLVKRRGVISANVITGIRNMSVFGSIVRVKDSFQTDSLYRISGSVESWDEECEIVATPLKEFSVLTLRINNTAKPFLFRLNGVWDRIDVSSFRPGRGNVAFSLNDGLIPAGEYRCLLSRQGDESLSLEVYDMESEISAPVRVLPLGKLMTRAGYVLDAVPMQDVTVDVDLSEGIVSVKIGDWDAVVFSVYTF